MLEFFNANPAQSWIIIGVGLIILEMLLPAGNFFLWIGLAGFVTGSLTWLLDLSRNGQLFIFAALTISCVLVGKRVLKKLRKHKVESDTDVSNRLSYLVGRVVTLETPLTNGSGNARIGDSIWIVYSNDIDQTMPAGTQVRVVSVKDGKLYVETARENPSG